MVRIAGYKCLSDLPASFGAHRYVLQIWIVARQPAGNRDRLAKQVCTRPVLRLIICGSAST